MLVRALSVSALAGLAGVAQAQTIFGLTGDNRIVSFDAADPLSVSAPVNVNGLSAPGERLVGFDYRATSVAAFNNVLYGVSNLGRLYTLNPVTGAASRVGTSSIDLGNGTQFGINFNPMADRIRVVSNTGLNLRINPNDGSLVNGAPDPSLTFAAGDPLGVDPLNPSGPRLTPSSVATAYTNSVPGATSTVQFVIDSRADALTIQSPPNDGVQRGVINPALGVASLLLDVDEVTGFEILSGSNRALLAARVPAFDNSALYEVDLSAGSVRFLSAIDADPLIAITSPIPAPSAAAIAGLTGLVAMRRRRHA